MLSNVPMYTRPLATESPVQWFHDLISSPLDHSSFPVCASRAYSTAWVDPGMRRLATSSNPTSGYACWVSSPLPYANTTPLAITGGSARFMSREIHAGVNCSLPPFSSTLKATMAPSFTGPFSMGALNCECFFPQIGVSTQRVPLASSQLASDPQIPADAKLTSSLHNSGLR